jgi:branched-chain amino acid transport system permease protein/neutral amino acid transport system permease protein
VIQDLLVFGFVSGAIIALAALGLSLIFGQYAFLNFAYGDLLTLGAYLYFTITVSSGMYSVLGFLGALVAVAAFALVAFFGVFRRLSPRGAIIMTVASMGVSFALQNTLASVYGTPVRRIEIPVLPIRLGPLTELQITCIVAVLVLGAAVAFLLYGTRAGLMMRATADNRDLARTSGVSAVSVGMIVWGVGGALAGLAGVLYGAYAQLTPTMGYLTLFPVIAAVLIGGRWGPFGAAAGGLVIGVASELAAGYVGSAYKPAMAILALALVLLLRAASGKKARV